MYDDEPLKEKNKGGRPKKPLDYDQLDELCSIQCTGEECAAVLGFTYEGLNTRLENDLGYGFLEYFRLKSAGGKASLRRRQYMAADSGNVVMLIWLGKQWLGQADKRDDSLTVHDKAKAVRDAAREMDEMDDTD